MRLGLHGEARQAHLGERHEVRPMPRGAPHQGRRALQRRDGVVPARVVLAEHDTKLVGHAGDLPWRTSGSVRARRTASAPSFTIDVAQLYANRIASSHVWPNATPGALPIPIAASLSESSAASATPRRW